MRLKISHTTRYQYDKPVHFHPHLLYLRPRENPLLHIESFAFHFSPSAQVHWMRDDFDNLPASAHFLSEASVLEISSVSEVVTTDLEPFDFLLRDYALNFPFQYEPLHRFNLGIYLSPPPVATQAAIKKWLDSVFPSPPGDTVGWLFSLAGCMSRTLIYQNRKEEGIQAPAETLRLKSGACRDFAALYVAIARTWGVAARFVSGYNFDAAAAGAPGEMHAWVEVFLPGAGWRGLDPTHGIFCHNTYVPVAHAVVAESVNPIQGAFFSASSASVRLTTHVHIQRLSIP
jgi:transglutaminase-like putative cysteine protease